MKILGSLIMLLWMSMLYDIMLTFLCLVGLSCDSFPVGSHPTGEPGETVVQYFQKRYGVSIQYKFLNCLQVGTPQRPKLLPLEVSIMSNYSMDVSSCVNISSYIVIYKFFFLLL